MKILGDLMHDFWFSFCERCWYLDFFFLLWKELVVFGCRYWQCFPFLMQLRVWKCMFWWLEIQSAKDLFLQLELGCWNSRSIPILFRSLFPSATRDFYLASLLDLKYFYWLRALTGIWICELCCSSGRQWL